MPHFCTSAIGYLSTDWFSRWTNARIRNMHAMYPSHLPLVFGHIGQFFDDHVNDPNNKVFVATNCPSPWPSVLDPVYDAVGQQYDDAAMFLGNLYCRYAILRPETWWSFPNALLPHKPRTYVAHIHLHTMARGAQMASDRCQL